MAKRKEMANSELSERMLPFKIAVWVACGGDGEDVSLSSRLFTRRVSEALLLSRVTSRLVCLLYAKDAHSLDALYSAHNVSWGEDH